MDRLSINRSGFADPQRALAQEWLVTNGLGGFASGTVAQANTRRYHGLLVAALKPPVDRIVMVAKLDATASYLGGTYPLSCNEFADGTLAPQGFRKLAQFGYDAQIPTWTFAFADAVLEQRIWMARGANTCYVSYTLRHATAPLELELVPLCTYRDYHSHTHGTWSFGVDAEPAGCTVTAFSGARPFRLSIDRGDFTAAADWYWNFHHRVEAERGLDASENLFRPGLFRARLQPGETLNFIATCETNAANPATRALLAQHQRSQSLVKGLRAGTPDWVRDLALAADDFIVARADACGNNTGTTVIAGYPWFSDWGRDTMIALPGLTLATSASPTPRRSCAPSPGMSATACCLIDFPTTARRPSTTPSMRPCGTSMRSTAICRRVAVSPCSTNCTRCCRKSSPGTSAARATAYGWTRGTACCLRASPAYS